MDTQDCGCGGCGHDEDCCNGCETQTVVISLEGKNDTTCNVIGAFGAAETDYIALQPLESDEVLIFRYTENGDNITLDNIESDEEYERAAEAFYELFEDGDFDDDLDYDDFDEDFDDDFDDDLDDFDDML